MVGTLFYYVKQRFDVLDVSHKEQIGVIWNFTHAPVPVPVPVPVPENWNLLFLLYIKETEIIANHASIISRATSNDRGIYCIIFNTDLLYKCRQKRVKYSKPGVEKTSQPQMLIQKKLKKNEYPPPSCRSLTHSHTRTAHHREDRLVTTLFYLPTLSNSLCIEHEFWQLWVPESHNFFLLWMRRRRRRRLVSIFENYCCHFFIRQSRRVFDKCIQQRHRHSMTIIKNTFICV